MNRSILKREKLNIEFENVLKYPLTVVVASMGYGKSTSALSYLSDLDISKVVFSIDSDESSPHNIWRLLCKQIFKVIPKFGERLLSLGFPVDFTQTEKVIDLFEEYTLGSNIVIMIDDFHYIHSKEFCNLIEKIVRRRLKGLHFLILSRNMPDIKIEELTLKEYCFLVNQNLFKLDEDEIKTYFKLHSKNITKDECRQIFKLSEGWITVVYLILHRYFESNKIEMVKNIDKLIETSIMSQYTDEQITILKILSLLDSFTLKQASYVLDSPKLEKMLIELSSHNSFIRYDEHDETYRIHNVFGDYLKKEVSINPKCIDYQYIYKRAGEWCIKNNNITLGITYLLKAKEYKMILAEFEKTRMTDIYDTDPDYAIWVFEQIETKYRYKNPMAYLSFIGFYVTNIDPVAGEKMLDEVQKYYNQKNKFKQNMKNQIDGEMSIIRSYIEFNDLNKMRTYLEKAHKLTNGKSKIANIKKIPTFGSPQTLYLYYRERGKMFDVTKELDLTYPYYYELSGGSGAGFEEQTKAEYYLEIGDINKSELFAQKAIHKAREFNQVPVAICSYFALARCLIVKGEVEKAKYTIEEYKDNVEITSVPMLIRAYDLAKGYISVAIQNRDNFSKILSSVEISESEILYQGMGYSYIVYGKYLLINKQYLMIEVLCDKMKQSYEKFNNQLGFIHMYILDAIAKNHLYDLHTSLKSFFNALEIGYKDNIVTLFTEYGHEILELLNSTKKAIKAECYNSIDELYIDKLIRKTIRYTEIISKQLNKKEQRLTPREKDILKLILLGKTNKEISEILFVAEVTVRKNLTSIYRKLNVPNRATAIKKVMELQLL